MNLAHTAQVHLKGCSACQLCVRLVVLWVTQVAHNIEKCMLATAHRLAAMFNYYPLASLGK